VTIPHSIQPFWLKFQAIAGGDVQARFYEAFHFDDNEPSANKLAQLVLVGTKRATAGLAWSFEAIVCAPHVSPCRACDSVPGHGALVRMLSIIVKRKDAAGWVSAR
jgi:hypothetical protein